MTVSDEYICNDNSSSSSVLTVTVWQYLKSCNAVWVVSSIHRAVNDKTARDLLGEHFRRQLLMDGQYGSVSFICSKTDILNPSEIIRYLHPSRLLLIAICHNLQLFCAEISLLLLLLSAVFNCTVVLVCMYVFHTLP